MGAVLYMVVAVPAPLHALRQCLPSCPRVNSECSSAPPPVLHPTPLDSALAVRHRRGSLVMGVCSGSWGRAVPRQASPAALLPPASLQQHPCRPAGPVSRRPSR